MYRLALMLFVACSPPSAADAGDGGRLDSGSLRDAGSWPCAASSSPSGATWDAGVASAHCDADTTYCYVQWPHPGFSAAPAPECRALAGCAADPTCACLCSTGGHHCQTECRCAEDAGIATVSCEQI